jgi:hypothetical protein
VYPPFALDDADYPVRLAAMPGRLNRLSVLFRIFLLIPCQIVQWVIAYGALTIFQFASWLIVLIKGQLPDTIYQAMSAVLRYQIRVIGFAVMLTSAYPADLFGDPDLAGSYGQPQPGYGYPQPGYGGLPVYGGQRGYVAGPSHGAGCHGELTCVTNLDRTMASALTTYEDVLQTISVPSQAAAAKARLITATSRTAATLAELGVATSASQYNSTLRSSGVVQEMTQFGTAYDNLISALAP